MINEAECVGSTAVSKPVDCLGALKLSGVTAGVLKPVDQVSDTVSSSEHSDVLWRLETVSVSEGSPSSTDSPSASSAVGKHDARST